MTTITCPACIAANELFAAFVLDGETFIPAAAPKCVKCGGSGVATAAPVLTPDEVEKERLRQLQIEDTIAWGRWLKSLPEARIGKVFIPATVPEMPPADEAPAAPAPPTEVPRRTRRPIVITPCAPAAVDESPTPLSNVVPAGKITVNVATSAPAAPAASSTANESTWVDGRPHEPYTRVNEIAAPDSKTGMRLLTARHHRRLAQRDLAKTAGISISRIGSIEHGCVPELDEMHQIMCAINALKSTYRECTMGELLGFVVR